tara:strand:+ start:3598 stop:4077 length:480 start_codon:yes stop_codon:yes gene_type:complete
MTKEQAEKKALELYPIRKEFEGGMINIQARLQQEAYLKCYEDMSKVKPVSKETSSLVSAVCEHLNKRLGLENRKKHRPTTASTKRHISAREKEGYLLEDFIEVIDKKVDEWSDTEQEKYLRPETLFGNKFAGYLAQKAETSNNPSTEMQRNTDYSEGLS